MVSGVASCPAAVLAYVRCTLLTAAVTAEESETAMMSAALQFLEDNEFVSVKTVEDQGG